MGVLTKILMVAILHTAGMKHPYERIRNPRSTITFDC
jgi:hypothetical protein